jgi:hypothetical protein
MKAGRVFLVSGSLSWPRSEALDRVGKLGGVCLGLLPLYEWDGVLRDERVPVTA